MRERSMLTRIVVGLFAAAFFITINFAGNGLPFALGIALFAVWGASEFYQAVKKQGGEPAEMLGYFACVVFQIAAWTHNGERFARYLPALLLLVVLTTLLSELGKRRPKPIVSIGTTMLGAVYVGWLFSYLTLLHGMQPGVIRLSGANMPLLVPPIAHTTPGEWLVIFVAACTWLSDSGALFFGKAVGKHKLAPNISPGKTIEGSMGGLLTAVLAGAALGYWLQLPMIHAIVLSFLCGLFGQIGDLCESALKRDLNVKDFGVVLPGHGGILDRIDSVLFSAPLAYYYVLFFLMR